MTFEEVVDQALTMLQRRGRIAHRMLKRQFELDESEFEDLKETLLYDHPDNVSDDGQGLTWSGEASALPGLSSSQPRPVQDRTIVEDEVSQAEASPPVVPATDAERRQLTVMFCDLVGSTSLSGELDPEDLREVVRAYQSVCTDVIHRYEGHVAQLLGDGLLIYFGHPQAHEDDAQRAVHAGLGILQAIETLNSSLKPGRHIELSVRLGIHTGLVVIGEMGGDGRQEQLALGETPNVAARVQDIAEPNTVVVSAATYHLVQGYFDCEDLGSLRLKGVTAPIQIYRVNGERDVQSRLESAAGAALTPLVGRGEEVDLLRRRWLQSRNGQGQVVCISGEAGIGKSRLVNEIRQYASNEGAPVLIFQCSQYHINTTLYPVLRYLRHFLGLQREDTPEVQLAKLEQTLRSYSFPLDEWMPLLAPLLDLPLPYLITGSAGIYGPHDEHFLADVPSVLW